MIFSINCCSPLQTALTPDQVPLSRQTRVEEPRSWYPCEQTKWTSCPTKYFEPNFVPWAGASREGQVAGAVGGKKQRKEGHMWSKPPSILWYSSPGDIHVSLGSAEPSWETNVQIPHLQSTSAGSATVMGQWSPTSQNLFHLLCFKSWIIITLCKTGYWKRFLFGL